MSLFEVRASAGHVMAFFDHSFAPCTMACSFCPVPLRRAATSVAPAPDVVERAVAELTEILRVHQPHHVDLVSDDILAFSGLFELIAVAAAAGVPLRLLTAGIPLVDPALAARVAATGVRVAVTLLSTHADRYDAIAGRAGAKQAVMSAIDTARAAGVPLDVGIVVLDRNVDELPELIRLARDLGSDPIAVRVFHPDFADAPSPYYWQYPAYDDVLGALRSLAASGEALPHLELSNVPWCALPTDGLDGLSLKVVNTPNEISMFTFDACATCPARPRCSGVHAGYTARHPGWTVDPAQVERSLAWADARAKLDESNRQPGVPNAPDEATWREQVWPDAPRLVAVEPLREGAGYFFKTDTHGAFYAGDCGSTEREDRFREALRAGVRALRVRGAGVDAQALIQALVAVVEQARG